VHKQSRSCWLEQVIVGKDSAMNDWRQSRAQTGTALAKEGGIAVESDCGRPRVTYNAMKR